MAVFNPNLPLGLPDGSVRSLIALFFSGVTGWLWATSQAVPTELLVLTTGFVSYYLGTRGAGVTNVSAPDANVTIEKPYIPAENPDIERDINGR